MLLAAALGALLAVSPAQDRIAFGSKSGIYVIRPDGGGLRQLTAFWDEQPAWSPDGRRIAFARVEGGISRIYVMQADGSVVSRLTPGAIGGTHPTWSPDGTRIAFERDTSKEDGTVGIYVIRADGGGLRKVVSSRRYDFSPSWSPDGRSIAFQRGLGSVFVVGVNGRGLHELGAASSGNPVWSPDGKRLAFDATTTAGGRPRIGVYVMNADGSDRRLLRYGFAQPSWSPDGRRLAVWRITKTGKGAIYILDSQTRKIRWLTTLSYAESPSWRTLSP